MHSHTSYLAVSLAIVSAITAQTTITKTCPFLGPVYPKPKLPDAKLQEALDRFDQTFTTSLETGTSPYGSTTFNETSYSIAVFNAASNDPIYERHFTDAHVRNNPVGVNAIDSNSIYRLGSISKLLTVYMWLLEEGFEHFADPITKYIPELAEAAKVVDTENGVTANWSEITIGELASHIAGLSRSYGVFDLSYPWLNEPGLLPVSSDQVPVCGYFDTEGRIHPCSNEEILKGMTEQPVLFQASASPIYSDQGFMLMGIALERITNRTLEDLFTERIIKRHGLNGTSFGTPHSSDRGVIPGTEIDTKWDGDLGALSAAGAFFSTTADILKIGRGLLSNTFLSPSSTHRWLKPVTFTSNPDVSLGAPWEIFRAQVGNRNVDMYTKNGGLGAYATMFALVPDFGVGFSILSASAGGEGIGSRMLWLVSEMLTEELLPGLEVTAKDQAEKVFAGRYEDKRMNSTLEIVADEQPGLRVKEWISNGTDILKSIFVTGGSLAEGQYVDFRVQPNEVYDGEDGRVGFTGVWEVLPKAVPGGPFDLDCVTWGGANVVTYGNVGLEQFVFQVDRESGRAVEVQSKALRVSLARVQ